MIEFNNYISKWIVVWADSFQSADWSSLQIGLNDSFTNWNNLVLNIQISSCIASEYLKYLKNNNLTKESVEKINNLSFLPFLLLNSCGQSFDYPLNISELYSLFPLLWGCY